ncbi:hypothetical protein CYMTET_32688 [Cymbomonas tetramitiformis]|uniref:Uncharacterized protein n=1 Tax=Cymbomonas tetramitiformis TaxID=36881 RepID=A0AAE0FE98_9CHLO|nr:hypothetical protein CYMTET_32688 [Cymbomonas tetramitiformis]
MLQLRASMESDATSHGGAEALRAKLAFIEEKVYAGSHGLVSDSVLTKWLKEFDAQKSKALMNSHGKATAKVSTFRDRQGGKGKGAMGGGAGKGEAGVDGRRDRAVSQNGRMGTSEEATARILAVVAMLSHFTSRNPELMQRMRCLWILLDLNGIEVQARVKVYWPQDDAWYTGTVGGTESGGLTHIDYCDGGQEDLDMSQERYEVVLPAVQEGVAYVVFAFVTFGRPETGVSMRREHISITDGDVFVGLRREKGRGHVRLRRRLTISAAGVAGLVRLMQRWQQVANMSSGVDSTAAVSNHKRLLTKSNWESEHIMPSSLLIRYVNLQITSLADGAAETSMGWWSESVRCGEETYHGLLGKGGGGGDGTERWRERRRRWGRWGGGEVVPWAEWWSKSARLQRKLAIGCRSECEIAAETCHALPK